KSDEGRIVIAAELPPGVRLEDTQHKTNDIVAAIRTLPEVERVLVIGGSSPTGQIETRKAAIYVELIHKDERERRQWTLQEAITGLLAGIPDVRAWYVNDRGERGVNIAIMGSNPAELSTAVARLESAMRRIPGFSNVAASAGLDRPEVQIVPKT